MTAHDDGDTLDLTPIQCDFCKKLVPTSDVEPILVETAKRTSSAPAEYDEKVWCSACRERADYFSENEDYERARAGGWAD